MMIQLYEQYRIADIYNKALRLQNELKNSEVKIKLSTEGAEYLLKSPLFTLATECVTKHNGDFLSKDFKTGKTACEYVGWLEDKTSEAPSYKFPVYIDNTLAEVKQVIEVIPNITTDNK